MILKYRDIDLSVFLISGAYLDVFTEFFNEILHPMM
jgi:hypothetical protein